jgi:GntR family transcriptional regulator
MPEPQYRQIASDLRRRIESGEFPAGTRLPSELDLREAYGASRNVIRDAIGWLEFRDLVERGKSQGFTITRRVRPIVTTLSQDPETGRAGGDAVGAYDEYMQLLARRKEKEDLSGSYSEDSGPVIEPRKSPPTVECMPAPDYVAARLRIAQGDLVVRRYEEFWVNQMPWSVQANYYPMDLVQRGAKDLMRATDFEDGELRYIAESTGLVRCGYRVRILARKPTAHETKFFDLPSDGSAQVFSLIRTGYEQRDGFGPYPFRANFTVFPGDRHQFVINSGNFPDEPAAPARDSLSCQPS